METHSGLENTQEEGSAGRSKFHALTSWWRHNFFTYLLDYSIINQQISRAQWNLFLKGHVNNSTTIIKME